MKKRKRVFRNIKVFLFFGFLLCCGLKLYSQDSTFNTYRTYPIPYGPPYFWHGVDMFCHNDHYYFALQHQAYPDTSDGIEDLYSADLKNTLTFVEIDNSGNMVNYKSYNNTDYDYYSGRDFMFHPVDSGFISIFNRYYLDTIIRSNIFTKLDMSFDTVYMRELNYDTLNSNIFSVCESDDGYFMVGGIDTSPNCHDFITTNVEMLMMKLDQQGNLLWEKKHTYLSGGNEVKFTYADGVLFNEIDSTYIIKGYSNHSGYTGSRFISKFSLDGNPIWSKFFYSTVSPPPFSDMIITPENHIIACGAYARSGGCGEPYNYEGRLIKLRQDGSLIFDKRYRDSIIDSPSSDFYDYYKAVCVKSNRDILVLSSGYSDENGQYLGPLIKLRCYTQDGVLKWQKIFKMLGDSTISLSPLRIFVDDGDNIIISGDCDYYYFEESGHWSSSSRVFLLKLDQYGNNPLLTYHETDEITEVKDQLDLYPNPADDIICLKSQSISSVSDVFIYNEIGQIVKEQKLDLSTGQSSINVEGLKAGFYLIRIEGEGKIVFGSFIKS